MSRRHTKAVRILAHAKANLTLEVVRRRDDGFHEIRSLMVPLGLADRLEILPGGRRLRIEVPDDPTLEGEHNLALRAAAAFRDRFGLPGLTIRLDKRIPIAAGLGGGSSDAAAVLRGLAAMRGVDETLLAPLAESLGSDVPFFLKEAPALASGRGERLEPAPRLPELWLLLVKPDFGISAGDAYRAWSESSAALRAGEERTGDGGSMRFRMRRATLESARTAAALGKILRNDLQPGCVRLQPRLGSLLDRLGKLRSAGVLMSGSGSTCFAVFGGRKARDAAAGRFDRAPGETVFLTRALRLRAT